MPYKNPNDPPTNKDITDLQNQIKDLQMKYADLLRKYNALVQSVDVKERKLKQQIRNVENKIPRRWFNGI